MKRWKNKRMKEGGGIPDGSSLSLISFSFVSSPWCKDS
jgi:hypothetical protein